MHMQKWMSAALATLIVSLPISAWAVLGGKASSVQTDQVQMKAAVRPGAQASQYSVQTLQTPSGITIHEYADTQGNVFAVTWQGPFKPDLKQLLGQYFDTYVTAAQKLHGGLHHQTVAVPNLVVHSQGHMRAFSGMAYLPSLLPAGVKPSDLK